MSKFSLYFSFSLVPEKMKERKKHFSGFSLFSLIEGIGIVVFFIFFYSHLGFYMSLFFVVISFLL